MLSSIKAALESSLLREEPGLRLGCVDSCIELYNALLAYMRSPEGAVGMLLLGQLKKFVVVHESNAEGVVSVLTESSHHEQSGTMRVIYGWYSRGPCFLLPDVQPFLQTVSPKQILTIEFALLLTQYGKGIEVIDQIKKQIEMIAEEELGQHS